MSDATSENTRATPRPSTAPAAAAAAATAELCADMVIPADFATYQQQLRQEVADVIQQLRAEVNDATSGRMDMMNSISTALQKVSAKPAESKTYRISDLIPGNWEGSSERESSEASCRTCSCGCKRGQIKENRCLSGSRASTDLRTT